jgi:serine/threonine protein kinase
MRLFSGALESAERGALDGHISHCDRCAALIAEAARDTGAGSAGFSDRLHPAVLSPGLMIANRYHVRRLLGVGAMGEVHEVEDRLLGTVVALKTLNARLAGDASALARLKREVAAARSVTHPNVCRIFDLGSDPGTEELGAFAFLTMEYLPGVTLTKHLSAHGSFGPHAALPLLIQLADGLAAAHAAGILHRDLKAENIMLVEAKTGGLRAVITDFGLAGVDTPDEDGVEHSSGFSGTVAYAAPERIAGGRATAASDVYSLGLIAYEVLTNQRPIPGAARPRLAGDSILPAVWEKLLQRAVGVDPKARFANGGALAEALRAINGAATPAPRGRRQVAVLAATALVAIAVAAGWTSRSRQPTPAVSTGGPAAAASRTPLAPGPERAGVIEHAVAPSVEWPSVQPSAVKQAAIARAPSVEPIPAVERPAPFVRRRSPARRLLAASEPVAQAAVPSSAVVPAAAAPAKLPADDLVREVVFRPARAVAPDATSEAELVDPFARERLRADGTGNAP